MRTRSWVPVAPPQNNLSDGKLGLAQRFNVTPNGGVTLELGAIAALFLTLQYLRAGTYFTLTTLDLQLILENTREGLQGNQEALDSLHVIEQIALMERKSALEASSLKA